MGGNRLQGLFGEPGHRHARVLANARQQRSAQSGQVFPALTQRWNDDFDDVQAVIQILAKSARLHVGGEVAVGGTHNPHVHRFFLGGAQRAHAAFLDGPQQFRLHGQGQVPDLIQEKGASARSLEVAIPVLCRASVGALAGTEEFGFEQVLGDGAAVHRNARAFRALAAGMQGLRDELFASA